jgi:uncharacterized SAM-binding protein YcdF (DUF218 family)
LARHWWAVIVLVVGALAGLGVFGATSACRFLGPSFVDWLQADFERGVALPEASGVIVLGGGLHAFRHGRAQGPGQRVAAGLSLAKQFPRWLLIYTGRGEAPEFGEVAKGSGLTSPLLLDPDAGTTYENAVNVAALLGPRRSEPWILITSAWHMRRALAAFRRQGVNVQPYAVDFIDVSRGNCGLAAREVISLLYYHLTFRI